jgi:hypothetical protein
VSAPSSCMNAAAVVPMAAAVGSECAKTMADQSSKRRRKSWKRHERDDGDHMKLPKGKFGAIMADPAIPFTTRSRKGEGRTPQHHLSLRSVRQTGRCPSRQRRQARLLPVLVGAVAFSVPGQTADGRLGLRLQREGLHLGQAEPERCRLAHGHRLHHEKEHGGLLAGTARQTD